MISNKIEHLRADKKVSIEKLAQISEMTRNGLDKAIKKNDFKVSTLQKIAEFFEVPVSYFFDEAGPGEVKKEATGPVGGGDCARCRDLEKQLAEAKERELWMRDQMQRMCNVCRYPVEVPGVKKTG